jgi:hypothetical protein
VASGDRSVGGKRDAKSAKSSSWEGVAEGMPSASGVIWVCERWCSSNFMKRGFSTDAGGKSGTVVLVTIEELAVAVLIVIVSGYDRYWRRIFLLISRRRA